MTKNIGITNNRKIPRNTTESSSSWHSQELFAQSLEPVEEMQDGWPVVILLFFRLLLLWFVITFVLRRMKKKQTGDALMQIRCDGVYGFPGGLAEKEENPVDALNRKIVEETGLNHSRHIFSWDHHIQSYLHAKKQLVLHFFVMEITMDDLMEVAMKSLGAKEFGTEVFGIVQVPLFTMGDGFPGLSTFLSSQFSGNAAQELIRGIRHSTLLSEDEMKIVINNSN
ncbi:uncharacterized protein LOC112571937 isoform X3 [Pomacea canaliculata]|uniref:uncharacterized protein LOC112571937 isoform X3 n=1 Tax=Pomacea canaliculata TaxID=400727 RepID=UPI000D72BDA8|nr:uncharacterized protein LOC112571937 isoform X3 [Pomacea canaliculata]